MKIFAEIFLILPSVWIIWDSYRKAQTKGISSYFIKVPKILSLICGNPISGNKVGLVKMVFQLILLGWVVFWVGMVVLDVDQKTRVICFFAGYFIIMLMELVLEGVLFLFKRITRL